MCEPVVTSPTDFHLLLRPSQTGSDDEDGPKPSPQPPSSAVTASKGMSAVERCPHLLTGTGVRFKWSSSPSFRSPANILKELDTFQPSSESGNKGTTSLPSCPRLLIAAVSAHVIATTSTPLTELLAHQQCAPHTTTPSHTPALSSTQVREATVQHAC